MKEENPVLLVRNIFYDFFGEENVDLQELTIIVHFPEVTVTNEYNKSINITHLWVKVELDENGTIKEPFKMRRSEFTANQFFSGYCHSHTPIVDRNNFNVWLAPCLGSGPIRGTMLTLISHFSVEGWNLFCLELSKYITVESIVGIPYIRLETVGVLRNSPSPVQIPFRFTSKCYITLDAKKYITPSFISFTIAKRPFRFNFINGSYGIAMSDRDILITLSNLFIEYNNLRYPELRASEDELINAGILWKGKYRENKLYYSINASSISVVARSLIGTELFKFKGNPVIFNIKDLPDSRDPNEILLLSEEVVKFIIDKILLLINNKYGKYESDRADSIREAHRYI